MSLDSIKKLLGVETLNQFRFTTPLPFSVEDRQNMPWLDADFRFYGVEEGGLKKGGRAIALKGYVANEKGESIYPYPIVVKIPNIDIEKYTVSQIKDYLARLSEEGTREWLLTRKRLQGCEYANPIFDFNDKPLFYLDQSMSLPMTVQLFIKDALSLDDYLLKTKQRQQPYESEQGVPVDNWRGISNHRNWLKLARGLALGLADIHKRRVVHGDIWPPNVFIREDENGDPLPIFIDFGEAFPIEPQGKAKEQRDHAYRAPERSDSQSIVTEQADVYSFGKLLLHLAIGEEPILREKDRGHKRREAIRDKFLERNRAIIEDNPFIIDIICKCVSYDAVKRPSMREIFRALSTYCDPESYSNSIPKVSTKLDSLQRTWTEVTTGHSRKGLTVDPFLEEIVERKLDEAQELIKDLSSDVIHLVDNREELISALVGLFARLQKGDIYLSITIPRMWQGNALGLDGRYLSATQLATERGASIQRTFIFSVQEVGEEWAQDLADRLEKLGEDEHLEQALKLSKSIKAAVKKYRSAILEQDDIDVEDEEWSQLLLNARERLSLIIKSHLVVKSGRCKDKFDDSDFQTSKNCDGLYLGLYPVGTLRDMRILKSAHPVSVFFFNNVGKGDGEYLLMMTDCTSRGAYGQGNNSKEDMSYQKSKPELRGIKVFKSVLGVPQDRIREIEGVFKKSVNVGGWIEKLHKSLPPV